MCACVRSQCVCCVLSVRVGEAACAEVSSDTQAVAGQGFKLGCISCKKRSEVKGSATVEWYFRANGEADFIHVRTTHTTHTTHTDSHQHTGSQHTLTFFLTRKHQQKSNILLKKIKGALEQNNVTPNRSHHFSVS